MKSTIINKNKKLFFLFIIFLIFSISKNVQAVDPDEILLDVTHEERARHISKNIRCMVCQNQSIDDSNSELAKDLRVLIRKKITNGESNKDIYNFLTARYGDYILLKPALKINTIALWVLPFFFCFLGIFFIFLQNKRSKKN